MQDLCLKTKTMQKKIVLNANLLFMKMCWHLIPMKTANYSIEAINIVLVTHINIVNVNCVLEAWFQQDYA